MSETHEMVPVGRTDTGAEEWHCPRCGRRTLLRWPPEYEKTVLNPGDERAVHVGGRGGLRLGERDVAIRSTSAIAEADQRWLRANGIDWDGVAA